MKSKSIKKSPRIFEQEGSKIYKTFFKSNEYFVTFMRLCGDCCLTTSQQSEPSEATRGPPI